MKLALGSKSYVLSTRGLVMVAFAAEQITSHLELVAAQRPDIIEITLADAADSLSPTESLALVRAHFVGPISVRTKDARRARRWVDAGAVIAHDPTGLGDVGYLRMVEETGASLALTAPSSVADQRGFLIERVRWAVAAGVGANKIIVHSQLESIKALVDHAVVMFSAGDGSDAPGAHVLAMRDGARILVREAEDGDVRATRRTIDTVSELLARRETTSA